jgi:flagellar hook-associated protein 1 FlgK
MSTFTGLNISRLGMQAQQKALEVTSHNIANASTPGYSRQIAHMTPTQPLPYLPGRGALGTGVLVDEIARVRDSFLDLQIRKELQTMGYSQSRSDILTQVELVFLEPSETGVNSVLNTFFDSWQEVSLNPEGSAARAVLVQNAQSLVNTVKHTYEQLKTIRTDIDQSIDLKVEEVNLLAEQIKDLNIQIINLVANKNTPGDLLDRRDLLLDRIASIIDCTVVETDRGSVNLYLGGKSLVYESHAFKLATAQEGGDENWPAAPQIIWQRDGSQAKIMNGEIAGLLYTRDVSLKKYMEDFESLAWGIVNAVNTIHGEGMDLEGNTGAAVSAFFTGEHLETLGVNSTVADNLNLIAASQLPDPLPDPPAANPGDGGNALRIAQLRHAGISVDMSQTDLKDRLTLSADGTTTFENYFRDNIARLGVDSHESMRMCENQVQLLDMLAQRRDSISGVSLDEELANMVQFQLAYQASARMITSLNEMYDTLVNRMIR